MKQEWEKKSLSEVCQKQSSNLMQKNIDPEQGLYPVYGANNIVGYLDYYVQPKDYIGIIKDGSGVGRVNVYPKESSLLGTLQYIIPNDNMDLHYTAYVLQSMNLAKYASGAAIPHIYFKDYGKEKIGVPSLVKQKEIAEELDKINELIEVKRSQLADLDLLAQSLFYEMFGDPITNPKGWETTLFGNLIRLKSGDALSAKNFCNGQYPVYGGNGIAGYHNRYNISGQNIIIGRVGALCGNVRLINANIFVTDNAFVVNLQQNINLRFLVRLLTLLELRKYANAAAQPVISNSSLKTITIPIPPLSLQNEFATKIEAIEEQKKRIDSSIVDLRILLESRIDYWFNEI